jgi:hypothetical protein
VVPIEGAGERPIIEDRWRQICADPLDLLEPFVRIRQALEEAQRAVRPAA